MFCEEGAEALRARELKPCSRLRGSEREGMGAGGGGGAGPSSCPCSRQERPVLGGAGGGDRPSWAGSRQQAGRQEGQGVQRVGTKEKQLMPESRAQPRLISWVNALHLNSPGAEPASSEHSVSLSVPRVTAGALQCLAEGQQLDGICRVSLDSDSPL